MSRIKIHAYNSHDKSEYSMCGSVVEIDKTGTHNINLVNCLHCLKRLESKEKELTLMMNGLAYILDIQTPEDFTNRVREKLIILS